MAITSLLAVEAFMFDLLIALGLFVSVVWVISHAIFLIMRADGSGGASPRRDDPITTFVQENYGSHCEHENDFGEESLRKL